MLKITFRRLDFCKKLLNKYCKYDPVTNHWKYKHFIIFEDKLGDYNARLEDGTMIFFMDSNNTYTFDVDIIVEHFFKKKYLFTRNF